MRKWSAPFSHDHQSDEDLVNLTPLIDVVFVVLIMYILVAPLVNLNHVDLAPARALKQCDFTTLQSNAPIKIHVYADNTLSINGNSITVEELPLFLERAYQSSPNAHPQLYHDSKAQFGTYQSIKNAIESAGFESLDVILKPGQ